MKTSELIRETESSLRPADLREASVDERLAQLFGEGAQPAKNQPALAERVFRPQRPPETSLTEMNTSLTRLPSLRMLAGWLILVAFIVVWFLRTHPLR